jgi:branched-chain amino acid transport system ATP-binding protein
MIQFEGTDITRMPMHDRVHRGLVRSYQITSIFGRLSVLDNIALAIQARDGSSFRFFVSARTELQRYDEAAAIAARVGLGQRLDRDAGGMSHGEQRQLEVGIALATGARLLLLDEPMAGMGPDESERMVELLQDLRGERSFLLVEHDMDAVFRLADTISTLVFGRVVASGTPDEIRANPEVKRAYLGDEMECL